MNAHIPARAGSYAITWALDIAVDLQVGRLGAAAFPAGRYIYLGSAFGPGGLRARLRHHMNIAAKPHWHLDYLRPCLRPTGILWSDAPERLECAWARALAGRPGVFPPVLGFGSSDCACGCPAHLLSLPPEMDNLALPAVLLSEMCGNTLYRLAFEKERIEKIEYNGGTLHLEEVEI